MIDNVNKSWNNNLSRSSYQVTTLLLLAACSAGGGVIRPPDGADTVNNFKVGEDSLVLVEQNSDGVNSLSALLTAISSTLPANTLQLIFTGDGNSYTEFELKVTGTEDGIKFVLDEAIEGDLADNIALAAGTNGTLDITSSNAQTIIAQIFTATGSENAGDLIDVTIDQTPSGIDII